MVDLIVCMVIEVVGWIDVGFVIVVVMNVGCRIIFFFGIGVVGMYFILLIGVYVIVFLLFIVCIGIV